MSMPALFSRPCRAVFAGIFALVLLAPAQASQPDPRVRELIAQLDLRQADTPSREHPRWQSPRRVVVFFADSAHLARLRELAPDARVEAASDDAAQRRRQLARADVVIGGCSAANFADAPALRWYQAMSVGVENCVAVPGLAGRGVVLTNMQRTSAPPIAEHAIAMALALARGLPTYGRAQQAGEWQRGAFGHARELGGRTLLVVGLGGIGTEVARRADGLGMRVIATRNSGRLGPDFVAKVGLPDELLALAAEADVVVNAAPLTPATTDLFDAEFFNAMKPGGYFINIARGRSVVQDDLVAALRSGHLGGAGLDVTDPEPLPAGHPLWAMPNVIITPHVAGNSDRDDERSWLLINENLRRYVAGEALLNVVDIERGY
ncbi:D-2-hydroxyacid dehydrogenase [Arenimonas soli]|nr:D-2-hydroxyacid dehydrogenase [Arenimonas soli]